MPTALACCSITSVYKPSTETICLQPTRTSSAASRRRRSPRCTPTSASAKFLSFVFDGRYKFARYYAPAAFNTPQTLDQIFKYNDVQLFDLSEDPDELHNLALERDKYKDTILRMNALLNDLMTKEVGKNDGAFLPAAVRPKQTVIFDKQ